MQIIFRPAALFFLAVYFASLGYLYFSSQIGLIAAGVITDLILYAGLVFITELTVKDAPPPFIEELGGRGGTRVKIQTVLLLLIMVVVVSGVSQTQKVFSDEFTPIPILSDLAALANTMAGRLLGETHRWVGYNWLGQVILPACVLLLLGSGPRQFGFRRGRNTIKILGIWLTIPFISLGYMLLTGVFTPTSAMTLFVSLLIGNAFLEEFLYRGALQTRLMRWAGTQWALILQALIFGVLHFGFMYHKYFEGDLIAALSGSIVVQGISGLAFGYLFLKTRNLLACTVFHLMINLSGFYAVEKLVQSVA